MKFIYDKDAGDLILEIKGDSFKHLKVRRSCIGNRIEVRNLIDGYSYIYEIKNFDKKAVCELVFKSFSKSLDSDVIIAWAVVDSKVIEKTLPSLNELGLAKVIFVYSEFSQRNIKLDLDRFNRILIASSQQCGRNSIMKFEVFNSVDELLRAYKNVSLIDFGGSGFENFSLGEIPFIGPEGGFSEAERAKFAKKYSLSSSNILRSSTAIIGVASKILL